MASILADWNNLLGMLHRMIHNPAVLKKFAPFIDPEFIYRNENEKRVKGVRALFRILLDLNTEGRIREVLGEGSKEAIYPFLAEVRKLPDGDTKEAALDIMEVVKTNKD